MQEYAYLVRVMFFVKLLEKCPDILDLAKDNIFQHYCTPELFRNFIGYPNGNPGFRS